MRTIKDFVEDVIGSQFIYRIMDLNPDELQDYYYTIDSINEVDDHYEIITTSGYTLSITDLHIIEDVIVRKKEVWLDKSKNYMVLLVPTKI